MKKTFFLVFAISILFCFSTTSFAAAQPYSRDDINGFHIKLSNAPKNVYDFFYEWNKTPNNKRFLVSSGNHNLDSTQRLSLGFAILNSPSSIELRLQNKNTINGMTSRPPLKIIYLNGIPPPYSRTMPAVEPDTTIYSWNPWNSDFTVSFETYYSSVSSPFTLCSYGSYTDHDFNKNTITVIAYDVDINKTYEEYQASKPPEPPPSSSSEPPTPPPSSSSEPPPTPPSSSSEPPPPPVFPDIDIPSGPPSFPDIEIPDVDRPVIVPPYDDTYIWYDPNAWEDFFNDIRLVIGRVVNVAIILLSIILCIILIIKIIKYFLRGDDIFKDWRL